MYTKMRRLYRWPHLSIGIQAYVSTCRKCLDEPLTQYTSHRVMNLFPVAAALELVALEILCPLPTSTKKSQFISVTCDRFPKLTQTVPLRAVTESNWTRGESMLISTTILPIGGKGDLVL